ncbi:alkaline phosphatase [Puteibacter caeruleilacunae]|nr:alkaline phosphatase [Puteibacter caeruleilacunae]
MKASRYLFITAILMLFFLAKAEATQNENKPPLNVILLIGDGMGLSQLSSAYYYGDQEPSFSKFNHIGLINTSCTNTKITDSAAGATAFATGQRTYKGAIGVSPIDTSAITNIVEILSPLGYKTGLVATYSVTHATPAAFYAHIDSRDKQEEIAEQLVTSDVDFFASSGLPYFNDRKDGKNLIPLLEANGFEMEIQTLIAKQYKPSKKYGYLMPPESMPKKVEGRDNFLPDATKMALDYLSQNKHGFFLMVEGSQIDAAGHKNKSQMLIQEVLDFEKAVGEALEFAKKNKNTLVIVTADHETGGFTLGAKNGTKDDYDSHDYSIIEPSFATYGHSATLVPVFTSGPHAEQFQGIYNNNELFHKIISLIK